MKKMIVTLIILIIILFSIVFVLRMNKKKIKITSIKNFNYSYTKGYMINSDISYSIKYENKQYIAIIKEYLKPKEDAKRIIISSTRVKELEEILKKYEVNKWNEFNKSDKNVLDGDSFSLSIVMINKDTISAHGYMKWPKNYVEVKNELDKYFTNILESEDK